MKTIRYIVQNFVEGKWKNRYSDEGDTNKKEAKIYLTVSLDCDPMLKARIIKRTVSEEVVETGKKKGQKK